MVVLVVIFLVIFVVSSAVVYLLDYNPDNSVLGDWCKRNMKYKKLFNNASIVSLLLLLISLLFIV